MLEPMVTFAVGSIGQVVWCLWGHCTLRLTELARIKCIEQLTQKSPSIEEPDVRHDTLILQPTTRIPADLVTERSYIAWSATKSLKVDDVRQLTLHISRIHMPIPDAMAHDGKILAHVAGVEEPRADELVAEESRLVLVDH